MTIKTVTVWNVFSTPEQKELITAEATRLKNAGKTNGVSKIETAAGVIQGYPTVVPYTVTRTWATEADAQSWIDWVDNNLSPDHTAQIVITE